MSATPAMQTPAIIKRRGPKRSTSHPAKKPNAGPITNLLIAFSRRDLPARPAKRPHHEVVIEGKAPQRQSNNAEKHDEGRRGNLKSATCARNWRGQPRWPQNHARCSVRSICQPRMNMRSPTASGRNCSAPHVSSPAARRLRLIFFRTTLSTSASSVFSQGAFGRFRASLSTLGSSLRSKDWSPPRTNSGIGAGRHLR